jgi:hypothetical protein
MTSRGRRRQCVVLVVVVAAGLQIPARGAHAPSTRTVGQLDATSPLLARVSTYLADYGGRYATTVAMERYVQRAGNERVELESEFGITQTNGSWVGIRDVLRVDGRPVAKHDVRLASLLADAGTADARALADRLAVESARYNVGVVARTINNPAVVLTIASAIDRDRFRLDAASPSAPASTARIRFQEKSHPTIFRTMSRRDEPVEGTLWVDAATGRLAGADMTMVVLDARGVASANASLSVTFGRVDSLDVWVPVRLTETYTSIDGLVLATGDATYTNYRQFGVSTSETRGVATR